MKQEIQPPELGNPLAANFDGMYIHVRAFTGRDVRRATVTVLEASLLLVACNGPVSPTIKVNPDNTNTWTPPSAEVFPTLTLPTETPTATITSDPTAAAIATKEPEIGGVQSLVFWEYVNNEHQWDSTVPPEFAPFLTPTTTEQWKALTPIIMDDGKAIPWGSAISYIDVGSTLGLFPVVPGLVRGVVPFGMYQGFPRYGAIIEFPVKGGSVFWIAELDDSNGGSPNFQASRLLPGTYPAACAGGETCNLQQILPILTGSHIYSDRQLVRILQSVTGRMVLFLIGPDPAIPNIIDAIAANGTVPIGGLPEHYALGPPELWYPDSMSK